MLSSFLSTMLDNVMLLKLVNLPNFSCLKTRTLFALLICFPLSLLLSCEKIEDTKEEEELQTTTPPKKSG